MRKRHLKINKRTKQTLGVELNEEKKGETK